MLETPLLTEPEEVPAEHTRSRPVHWLLAVLLPVGALLVYAGLSVLSDASAWPRFIVGILGVGVSYVGLDALLRAVVGHKVDTGVWLAVAWLTLVLGAAVFADLLPLAESRNASRTLLESPRARPDIVSGHPLGTDHQALDTLGGVIYGARVSLQVSFFAVAIGTVIGGLIGTAAGYFRGRLDAVVGLFTDSVLAFPPLILLLAVVSVIDASVFNISLALALLSVPTYTRLARANTLALAQREFVLSARAMGARDWRIIFTELVPNVVRPLLSYGFIIIAVLIVAEASLSFLGVGIQRPTPTWGNMISAGQGQLETTPHLVFVPGGVMFLTVFALNRVGDRARQLFDPRKSAI